jgi:hypothetical protein
MHAYKSRAKPEIHRSAGVRRSHPDAHLADDPFHIFRTAHINLVPRTLRLFESGVPAADSDALVLRFVLMVARAITQAPLTCKIAAQARWREDQISPIMANDQ